METVIINGVKYIPAKDVIANSDAIFRALMQSFWGELGAEYDHAEMAKGVFVWVNDSGDGIPIQEVMDAIAEKA